MHAKPKIEYASFWQRLLAFLLDLFIIIIPVFSLMLKVMAFILFDEAAIKSAPKPELELIYQLHKSLVFIALSGFGAAGLVIAFFTISRWQASPGKRLVGIYIIKNDGSKPNLADAFGRFISLPLFIFLLQIFERKLAYAKLDELKANNNMPLDIPSLQAQLVTPISEITGLVVFSVIGFWFLRVFFHKQNAAFHDTLFNTRVVVGKV